MVCLTRKMELPCFPLFIFFLASYKRQRNGPRRVVYLSIEPLLFSALSYLVLNFSFSLSFSFLAVVLLLFTSFSGITRKKKEEAK
ncbi:uncharacterized protein ARB_01076 [Trichophyton benhamiae CBS 112371]|uniref:Uncharacterized protein n=1 Tax=Arthroderma benhamiae (strain ATCC MYA-4681 / CBS 112371) TaxID=663331 RepID=D4AY07_ARTBC|nr:uncharacterized protein ARB_01076 [Trichophyton benhamiae CBS 112371]EFE32185.1 hypothetical protein ARB_01076 [Trichophyton benhamiae CBS 112371]